MKNISSYEPKPGDKVKVVRRCSTSCKSCNESFGKIRTIKSIYSSGMVRLEEVADVWEIKNLKFIYMLPEDLFEV
jgi:hypothetical protein